MKLPSVIKKLTAVKGVFARLNPMGAVGKLTAVLTSKIKLKGKRKKKKKDEDLDEDDFRPSGADDGDMFGDLGDLDELDRQAVDRKGGEDDEHDYSPTEMPEDMDRMTSGDDAPDDAPDDFADLEAEDAAAEAGGAEADLDLAALEDMPDFDEDSGAGEDEDDEEALKAKKKKLLILAGGGIAAAVLIGAASWLVLTPGEDAAPTREPLPGLTIALDEAPMVDKGASGGASRPSRPAATSEGMAAPADDVGVMGTPDDGLTGTDRTLAQLGLNVQPEPGVGVVVPAVTQASYAAVPAEPPGKALRTAPIDALVEPSDMGRLPKIAADGLTPYDAYARPEPQNLDDSKPKVAIIITDLGLSRAATEAAISTMPERVSMSLNVYARGLDFWVANIRDDGHEVLLEIPMETENFPFNDPGPDALKVLDAPEDNVRKLKFLLSRTVGYFGVLSMHGAKFLKNEDQVNAVMTELKNRGLMYVDSGAEGSLGTRVAFEQELNWAAVEMNMNTAADRDAFADMLAEFEALARKRAIAVARVSATPMSLEMLSAWIKELDAKGLQLVPVSALAKKQLIR